MKQFFKNPLVIILLIAVAIGLLYWGGSFLYKSGIKNGLQQQLDDVNHRMQNTSARSSEHPQLLGKKIALEKLIAQL